VVAVKVQIEVVITSLEEQTPTNEDLEGHGHPSLLPISAYFSYGGRVMNAAVIYPAMQYLFAPDTANISLRTLFVDGGQGLPFVFHDQEMRSLRIDALRIVHIVSCNLKSRCISDKGTR